MHLTFQTKLVQRRWNMDTLANENGPQRFFARWAYGLGDVFFQLGISGPGRLWYKDSERLSAKDKSLLDEELLGTF